MRRYAIAVVVLAVGCNKSPNDSAGAAAAGSASAPPQAAAAAALPSLGGFEGEIDVQVKDADKPPPRDSLALALLIKNGKLRTDLPASLTEGQAMMAGAYVILDTGAKKVAIVQDPRKQVMVLELDKMADSLKGMVPQRPGEPTPPKPPEAQPTITDTGKSDTVAGYKCENWDVVSEKGKGTVCVAEVGASWLSLPTLHLPTEHAWMSRWLDGQHVPLRFIGYDKGGTRETARIEATKIDKRTLPDSTFEYPPTYKVMDLEQMMRGMMVPGGMPGGMPGGPPGGMPGGGGMPGHHGLPPGFPSGFAMAPHPLPKKHP